MENTGTIDIIVTGKYGQLDLSPAQYDIKYIGQMLKQVEQLLYPDTKKERPLITYDLKQGSVHHRFTTSLQSVIGFTAIIGQIAERDSIDFLELSSAKAIEAMQQLAQTLNYNFRLSTSVDPSRQLAITPTTKYFRTAHHWAEAEFYFYGTLKDAGGKNKANIHLDTKDHGYLTITTERAFLEQLDKNPLYQKLGVRAIGRQNLQTGEIDTSSLQLIELVDYHPKYDPDYLDALIDKARSTWEGVDTDQWLNHIRESYEA